MRHLIHDYCGPIPPSLSLEKTDYGYLEKKRRGRKPSLFDADKLRRFRGGIKAAVFADLCHVSIDTIQRAESTGHASPATLKKIVKYLRSKGHEIRVKDFKKVPQ
jgi:hypothetical protein